MTGPLSLRERVRVRAEPAVILPTQSVSDARFALTLALSRRERGQLAVTTDQFAKLHS
jgi:hypothetical protein